MSGTAGWATADTGMVLMCARLCNPVTGQFTSPDPVFGGNSTAYAYPQDPINASDLNGMWWRWVRATVRWADRHLMVQLQGCFFAACTSAAYNHHRFFVSSGVSGGNWIRNLGDPFAVGLSGGFMNTPLERTHAGSVHGCLYDGGGGCLCIGTRGRRHHRHATLSITGGAGIGFVYGLSYQSSHSWRLW